MLFTNFHQMWRVAAAINAEQYALKLSISHDVWTHTIYLPCNIMKDRQNCDKIL